jgi:NADH:ubiquinone oxidoreductase subunit 5 (subunit L)/multisubunit Na+/H+ antiporter MnhA subunit
MKKSNNDEDKNNSNSNSNSDINSTRSDSNIFYIMDEIIDQLNKTKKLFIIMLLTIMIIPPIAFMLSFMLFGLPFHDDYDNNNWTRNGYWGGDDSNSNSPFNSSFRFLPLIPVIVVIVWMGIGIRQWFILSKWDKKYKKYKELQKKVDEDLGKDDVEKAK